MSKEIKHVGLFGVAGILVAALEIAGFVIGRSFFQVSGKGALKIQVMDEPVELDSARLTKRHSPFVFSAKPYSVNLSRWYMPEAGLENLSARWVFLESTMPFGDRSRNQ